MMMMRGGALLVLSQIWYSCDYLNSAKFVDSTEPLHASRLICGSDGCDSLNSVLSVTASIQSSLSISDVILHNNDKGDGCDSLNSVLSVTASIQSSLSISDVILHNNDDKGESTGSSFVSLRIF